MGDVLSSGVVVEAHAALGTATGRLDPSRNLRAMPRRMHGSQLDGLATRLVYARAGRLGKPSRLLLQLFGIDVPKNVMIGRDLELHHATSGLVIHPDTVIGDRVTLLQNVTVGRADPWIPVGDAGPAVIELRDDVILGAGAVVLTAAGTRLVVGEGTIVGANAVLTRSTGRREVWAGNPAKKVRDRPDD